MKRFLVSARHRVHTVQANWYRITPISNNATFYRGLRKVAWIEMVDWVTEEEVIK